MQANIFLIIHLKKKKKRKIVGLEETKNYKIVNTAPEVQGKFICFTKVIAAATPIHISSQQGCKIIIN